MSQDQPTEQGILYTENQLANYSHRLSRLKPVEPGDMCCSCGDDCDGPGFAVGAFHAIRINGHPICARGSCYGAQIAEFSGRRDGCRCGLTKKAQERRRLG